MAGGRRRLVVRLTGSIRPRDTVLRAGHSLGKENQDVGEVFR